MIKCNAIALATFGWLSLAAGARSDVVLRPLAKEIYDSPSLEGPGSIDACSEDMLVVAFQNGFVYRIDLKSGTAKYLRIAGDSNSLLKQEVRGSTVKCLDSNTFYLRDTWNLFRIRVNEKVVDTLELEGMARSIFYNLVTDTLGNHYFVAGQRIYRIGKDFQQIAKAPSGLWNVAVRDSNDFIGVGQNHLYHYQNGRLDSIASPRGYDWFGCLWIRNRYLVRDRGLVSQAYTYDPVTRELKNLVTDPDFKETAWGIYELSYARFEDKDFVVSDGNLFRVNDTGVYKVEVAPEGGGSPIKDKTFAATHPKFKDTYLLSGGRVGKIISAEAAPVGISSGRRNPYFSKLGVRRPQVLSEYRLNGVRLESGKQVRKRGRNPEMSLIRPELDPN